MRRSKRSINREVPIVCFDTSAEASLQTPQRKVSWRRYLRGMYIPLISPEQLLHETTLQNRILPGSISCARIPLLRGVRPFRHSSPVGYTDHDSPAPFSVAARCKRRGEEEKRRKERPRGSVIVGPTDDTKIYQDLIYRSSIFIYDYIYPLASLSPSLRHPSRSRHLLQPSASSATHLRPQEAKRTDNAHGILDSRWPFFTQLDHIARLDLPIPTYLLALSLRYSGYSSPHSETRTKGLSA
jgi:hypothetical protein